MKHDQQTETIIEQWNIFSSCFILMLACWIFIILTSVCTLLDIVGLLFSLQVMLLVLSSSSFRMNERYLLKKQFKNHFTENQQTSCAPASQLTQGQDSGTRLPETKF